jgi:hypothetical protein
VWFFHAPLENHADPQVTPLHTTAPWYFLWLQGMLKLGDKVLFGIVVPTIIFGVMFIWPYIDLTPSRRYAHRRVALSFGVVVVFLFAILQYMGTPFYAVDTAANTEVSQELIPQEGVGPVRAIPYDELVTHITVTDNDNVLWTSTIDQLNSGDDEIIDSTLAPLSIVVTEDNLDDLAEEYEEDSPDLFHVLEELHYLLYDEFAQDLPNAVGYLSISQQQENMVRVYLLMTWDTPEVDEELGRIIVEDDETRLIIEEDGTTQRSISGKAVYIHQESEWHEH